jgi:hypothetical protein
MRAGRTGKPINNHLIEAMDLGQVLGPIFGPAMTDPRTLKLKLRRMRYGAEALATQALAKRIRFVFKEQHETAEAATARFRAQHPDASECELVAFGWLPADDA